jgi:hypothetical protein
MYICMHMRLFLLYVLYIVWCLSKSYAHTNNCRKTTSWKKKKKRKKQHYRLGTKVIVRGFNAGLLARSQFASWRSCDRPTRSRFSVVFLSPRANAELIPKFHFTLHASHAALPIVTLKISPCNSVTLTFDFDFGLDHPVRGGYGWRSPTPRKRSKCQTKKLKSGHGSHLGPGTKTDWPTDRRSQCNLKLNLRHCTANYRPVLSSERAPCMKNK